MAKILSTYETLSQDTRGLIHDFAREIKPSDMYMPIRRAFINSRLKFAEAKDKGCVDTIEKLKEKFLIEPNLCIGAYIWAVVKHDFDLKLFVPDPQPDGPSKKERNAYFSATTWAIYWSDIFTIDKKLEELSGSKDPVKLAKSAAYQKEVKRDIWWDINHWRC